MLSSFNLWLLCFTQKLTKLTSTGITASDLNAKENGVSPIGVRMVVLSDHNIFGRNSTYAPFLSYSFFFNVFMKVLFVASTWPFAWGYPDDEK